MTEHLRISVSSIPVIDAGRVGSRERKRLAVSPSFVVPLPPGFGKPTSKSISLRNFSCIKCFLCWTLSRSCFRICHFFTSSLYEMCSGHSKNRIQACNVDRPNSYTVTSTSFRVDTLVYSSP